MEDYKLFTEPNELYETMQRNKPDNYPISNDLLFCSGEGSKTAYIKMLGVVLRQNEEINEAQQAIFKRIIAGANSDFEAIEYLRMAKPFDENDLQIFIECLLHDKTFYAFTKKGNEKRLMTKKIIDKELKKHLLKVVPKEFRFLVTNVYFLAYINELFLPLEKNRIIITIEKFFELSLYEKNSLYDKFNINYDKYETARIWINRYRIKYKDVLEKYKNDPEYQTIEKIQSVQQIIRKSKTKPDDDKTLDHTMDDFYIY